MWEGGVWMWEGGVSVLLGRWYGIWAIGDKHVVGDGVCTYGTGGDNRLHQE